MYCVINKYGKRKDFDSFADARYYLHNQMLKSYLYSVDENGRLDRIGEN